MPDRYYIWGVGSVGKRALGYLVPLNILAGIIDGDDAKHGEKLCGLTVAGYESIKPYIGENGVIIAHFESKEAEELLKRDKVDYWRLSEFITMFYWKQWRQRAIGFLDFPITTRCTLNCRDCMQYIPYRPKLDIPLETLKHDLKALFHRISFVGEISIIGGEPFLHEQFPEFLQYVAENYHTKIGSLVITTNGTVTPDSRILEQLCKMGAFISVSDYSETLPRLEEKIAKLESATREAGATIERKRWNWTNPGRFDTAVDSGDCAQTHMQLADGKIWRCTLMAAGHSAGFCAAVNGYDYYDLQQENGTAMKDFFDANNLSERTSQCRKCLYQKGFVIPTATQK